MLKEKEKLNPVLWGVAAGVHGPASAFSSVPGSPWILINLLKKLGRRRRQTLSCNCRDQQGLRAESKSPLSL